MIKTRLLTHFPSLIKDQGSFKGAIKAKNKLDQTLIPVAGVSTVAHGYTSDDSLKIHTVLFLVTFAALAL